MTNRGERIHSRYLFPAIVLILVAQPVFASLTATETRFVGLLLAATLVVGIWSLDPSGIWLRIAGALGLAVLASAAAQGVFPHRAWQFVLVASLVSLGCIATALGVRHLFSAPRVTLESLLTALSVYLLLGISFALVNGGIYLYDPTAFHGVSPSGSSAEVAEFVYYTLGLLTGTALGDVLPVHPISRFVANVEAVVGQMYVAVLVAKLVSGYVAGRGSPDGGDASL